MSYEPGRTRHMIHWCAKCATRTHEEELIHVESVDEYWCGNCVQNQNEADYERLCKDFHDGGSTRFPDAERVRMEAVRKLK